MVTIRAWCAWPPAGSVEHRCAEISPRGAICRRRAAGPAPKGAGGLRLGLALLATALLAWARAAAPIAGRCSPAASRTQDAEVEAFLEVAFEADTVKVISANGPDIAGCMPRVMTKNAEFDVVDFIGLQAIAADRWPGCWWCHGYLRDRQDRHGSARGSGRLPVRHHGGGIAYDRGAAGPDGKHPPTGRSSGT